MTGRALAAFCLLGVVLQAAQAQLTCYKESTCNVEDTEFVSGGTKFDCCLKNASEPRGYTISGSTCQPCFVIGFTDENVPHRETQGLSEDIKLKIFTPVEDLHVKYQVSTMVLTVTVNGAMSTATYGVDFRFDSPTQINQTEISVTPDEIRKEPVSVRIQLVDDDKPGEVEHFVLEVTSAVVTPLGSSETVEVFITNSVRVDIEDDDVIDVQFHDTEISISESEKAKNISFIINNALTEDVHLFLLAMTYKEYDDMYNELSTAYPNIDEFTLPDEYDQAEPEDFFTKKVPFTIKKGTTEPNTNVTIFVNDEDILEPREEGFRLVLTVDEDRTPKSLVTFGRQLALFRIDNNDDEIILEFMKQEHFRNDTKREIDVNLPFIITKGSTEVGIHLIFTFDQGTTADRDVDFDYFSELKVEITEQTVHVQVHGDDLYEPEEVITVTYTGADTAVRTIEPFKSENLSSPGSKVKYPEEEDVKFAEGKNYARIIIRGDPDLLVDFTVPHVVQEGEFFFPRLTASQLVEAMFEVKSSSGTAKDDEDYSKFHEIVIFNSSASAFKTDLPFIIKNDSLVEPNETFNIEAGFLIPTKFLNFVNIRNSVQTITIIDKNIAIIGFRQEVIEVSEGAGVVILTVEVLGDQLADGAEVTVRLSTMAGNASDEDFTQVTSQDLVLNANQQEHTVSIDIFDDALYEDKELFTVNLVRVDSNVNVNVNPSRATVSISDNDQMSIGFKKTMYEVREEVGSVSFEVEVKNNGMFDVPLDFTVTDIEGEAKRMVDYNELANVALQLKPGQTSVEYSITIIDDDAMEPDSESFRITLHTNQPRVTAMPGSNEAVVTITNDDNVTIGFDNVMYQFRENASFPHQVCVSIMEKRLADNRNVDVMLKSRDETAIASSDYEPVDQVLTFTSSMTSSCVNVSIKPDNVLEKDEIFVLSLTSSDSSVNLDPEEADVMIEDGIPDVDVSVSFKSDHSTYNENDGQAVVEVVLLGQIEVDVTVSINGGPSTQTDIGTDRVVFSDMAKFVPGGPTEIDVSTPIVNDVVALEDSETVHVSLTIDSPMSGVTLGAFPTTTVTIVDNDVVDLSFTKSEFDEYEDVGKFTVCVQKQLQTIKDFSVDIDFLNGTASGHLDYTLMDTMVLMTKNSLEGCFDVEIIDDNEVEGNETFFLELDEPMEDNVLLVPPYTVNVTIIDDDVHRGGVCTLNSNLVLNTFSSETQPGQNFSISEGCEHKLVTSCDDMLDLEIRVDFFKDNFTSTKVAIIYEGERFIINEDLSLEPAALPTNSGIVYTKDTNFASVSIPELMLTVTRNLTELNVTTRNESLPLAGLCGGLDGKMYFRNCSEGVIEGRNVRKFKNSYRLKPDDQILREERQECGITANDTVIGDPLMTVPINVPKHEPDHLCYEIHGAKDKYFNFISDECTSVNAHYVQASVDEKMNIIDSISIVAIDKQHTCHNISVSVLGCSATVDGNTLQHMSGKQSSVNSTYDKNGISVRSYKSRTRISVPNCADNSLVMWVFCQHQPFQDPINDSYTEPVDMIKFEITRGRNLKEYSHGLLGQFWNIPIKVEPFTGVPRATADPEFVYYTVNVTHPRSESRVFIGVWFDMTWEFESKECLYVGNKQGGPVGEVEEPNDSVIQGVYTDYTTADAFETDFEYAVFKKDMCSSP